MSYLGQEFVIAPPVLFWFCNDCAFGTGVVIKRRSVSLSYLYNFLSKNKQGGAKTRDCGGDDYHWLPVNAV